MPKGFSDMTPKQQEKFMRDLKEEAPELYTELQAIARERRDGEIDDKTAASKARKAITYWRASKLRIKH